jgi:hypothetical protein
LKWAISIYICTTFRLILLMDKEAAAIVIL